MLDVDYIKKEKEILEKKIAKLITEFRTKTNITVIGIDLEVWKSTNARDYSYTLVNIGTEIKLENPLD